MRRVLTGRRSGSGDLFNHRYLANSKVAGKAAPAAIDPVMSNAHTGVLQVASSAVTDIQKAQAKAKNAAPRSAQRR
jgi:hypothetical protein